MAASLVAAYASSSDEEVEGQASKMKNAGHDEGNAKQEQYTPAFSLPLVSTAPPVAPKVHAILDLHFFLLALNAPPPITLHLISSSVLSHCPNTPTPKYDHSKFGSQETRRLDPKTKEVFYNPTVDELYAPQVL